VHEARDQPALLVFWQAFAEAARAVRPLGLDAARLVDISATLRAAHGRSATAQPSSQPRSRATDTAAITVDIDSMRKDCAPWSRKRGRWEGSFR